MAKRTKYNPAELGRKLSELEAILGSQKKAAEKLGVNVSTYRAYKTGKAKPSADKLQKANRVYGQNKRKLESPEVKSRIERRAKQTETKRKAREAQLRRDNVVYEGTNGWLRRKFGDEEDLYETFVIQGLSSVSMYAAHPKQDDSRVQFTDGFESVGKPAGQKFVTIYGLYTLSYIVEAGKADVDNSTLKESKMPILIDIGSEWDLETTLNYLERKFYDTAYQTGRRKFMPTRFIGFSR